MASERDGRTILASTMLRKERTAKRCIKLTRGMMTGKTKRVEIETTEESRFKEGEFKLIAELALAIVAVLKPSFPQRSPEGKQFLSA